MGLNNLPNELILKIISLLQNKDIVNLRSVDKTFKKMIDRNKKYIYSDLIKKDFLCSKNNEDTYKMFYSMKKTFFDISKMNKILNKKCYNFLNKDNHCDLLYKELINSERENKIYLNVYIDLGYNINSVDKNGDTIVMKLLHNLDIDEIGYLKSFDIDFNIKNNKGENFFLIACKNCNGEKLSKVVEIIGNNLDIECRDNNGNTPLLKSLENWWIGETFVKLLEYNPNINSVNNYGENILLKVSKKNNLKTFNKVIEVLGDNLDINFKDNNGETALFKSNNCKIIQNRILELNADISIRNNNRRTYKQKRVRRNGFFDNDY